MPIPKSRIRCILADIVIWLMAVTTGLVGLTVAFAPTARAQTTSQAFDPTKCQFREFTEATNELGQSLCWINFKDFNFEEARTVGSNMEIRLDPYVLKFKVNILDKGSDIRSMQARDLVVGSETFNPSTSAIRVRSGNRYVDTPTKITWDKALFGRTIEADGVHHRYFVPESGSDHEPVLGTTRRQRSVNTGINPRIRFSNVRFEHVDGQQPQFSLIVADAESTTNERIDAAPEFIGLRSYAGGKFTQLPSAEAPQNSGTPSAPTCGGGLRENFSQSERESGQTINYNYDLYCLGGTVRPGFRGAQRSGIFFAKVENPQDFEVTLGGIQNQGVAFAVQVRSTSSVVQVARRAENGVIDQHGRRIRESDFSIETRVVDTATGTRSPLGSTRTVVNKANPAQKGSSFVATADQKLEFFSTVANTESSDEAVIARYRPEWQCTNQLKEGAAKTPIAAEVTTEDSRPQSTALVDVPNEGTVECTVIWQERFPRTGVINVSKTTHPDLQDQYFKFEWNCEPPDPKFLVGYEFLAPRILTGNRRIQAGGNFNISGLPVGAQCTITESGGPARQKLTYRVNNFVVDPQDPISVGTSTIRLVSHSEPSKETVDLRVRSEVSYVQPGAESEVHNNHNARVSFQCENTPETTVNLSYRHTSGFVEANDGLAIDRSCTITYDQNRDAQQKRVGYIDSVSLEYDGQVISGVLQGDVKDGVFRFEVRLPADTNTEQPLDVVFKPRLRTETYVLEISKTVTGSGASRVVAMPTTVHWRCFVPGEQQPREGTIQATAAPQVTEALPHDSTCFVWEDSLVLPTGVEQVGETTIERFGAGTKRVITNSQAKQATEQSPHHILTLNPGTNKVVLSSEYIQQVAPVKVRITGAGPAAHHANISSYSISYTCGTATVGTASGLTNVVLAGFMDVPADTTTSLVYKGELKDILSNDSGELLVPIGNVCSVTVQTVWAPRGIRADVPTIPRKQVEAGNNLFTATVEYNYAGSGLTINANFATNPELGQPIPTAVVCSRPGIIGIFRRVVEISPQAPQLRLTAEEVPAGSECAISMSEDSGERSLDGRRALSVRSLEFSNLVQASAENNEKLEVYYLSIPNDNAVIDVTIDYEYVMRSMAFAVTNVEAQPERGVFADYPETESFAPTISVICQLPNGTEQPFAVKISNNAGQNKLSVPAFTQCSATQEATAFPEVVTVDTTSTTAGSAGNRTINYTVVEDNQEVRFTNSFARATTSVTVVASFEVPDNPASGGSVVSPTPTAAATVTCAHGGREVFSHQVDVQPGDNQVADVPAGLDCKIAARSAALEVGFTLDGEQDPRTAYLDPSARWTITDGGQTSEASGSDAADENINVSPVFRTKVDHGATGNANRVTYGARYQWRMGQAELSKQISGAANHLEALKRTSANLEFSFTAICASPDSTAVDSSGLATPVRLSQFARTDTVVVGKLEAPIGSLCTITESQDAQLPQGFSITPQPDTQVTVSLDDASVNRLKITNHVTRTTTPYEVIAATAGEEALRHGDTELSFRCIHNGHQVDIATSTVLVAGAKQPHLLQVAELSRHAMEIDNPVYHLPIGAQCTVTAGGSALDPRPELKAVGTPQHRIPPTIFALNDKVVRSQPEDGVAELGDYSMSDGILDAWNKHSFTFEVPELTDADSIPLFAISHLIRDKVDLTLGKTLGGIAPKSEFPVTVDCGAVVSTGEVSPRRDLRVAEVPVGSACSVVETHGGTGDGSTPSVEWDFGAGLAPQQPPRNETALISVKPVAQVSDSSVDGQRWRMSIRNNYPKLSLTRSIAGAGIIGAIVLPPEATTATVEYTVRNDGATALRGITISEENSPLAGCTIPDLEPGASHTCYREMPLAEPGVMESHEGHATASATDAHNQLTATASTTVIRLPFGGAWQLPDTGVRTLVFILLLGLVILGVAVVRYIRSARSEAED